MKKNKKIIEISLTFILLFINFLSYVLEPHRLVVFVLGIIYLLLFLGQLLISIIKLKRKELPFGIITTIVFIILFQNDSVNSNYMTVENRIASLFVILAIVILTLVLILFFSICLKKTWKEDYFPFFFISFLLSLGSILYGIFPIVNYSFDMTKTQIIEVTVTEYVGEENLKGAFFDTHYLYNIEAPNNISITTISVDNNYIIDVNTHILIKYRKGFFCEIYKIDYSSLTSIED